MRRYLPQVERRDDAIVDPPAFAFEQQHTSSLAQRKDWLLEEVRVCIVMCCILKNLIHLLLQVAFWSAECDELDRMGEAHKKASATEKTPPSDGTKKVEEEDKEMLESG
jgi:hypothetical protein